MGKRRLFDECKKLNFCSCILTIWRAIITLATAGQFYLALKEGEGNMKKDIHPDYEECTVRCACGEEFQTGSIKPEMRVEICSKCHPFYTGKQKLVDSGGRVDRFKRRYGL